MRAARALPRLHCYLRALAVTVCSLAAGSLRATPPSIGIAVLHAAPWSPNAAVREGAGEFEVRLCIAQLQRAQGVAGLLSVGDHNGVRPAGGENALREAALSGLPVVKLAPRGIVAATPDDLFIDGRSLDEDRASELLKTCLARFGAPPLAANPAQPSARELAAIRAHLRAFQAAFDEAARPLVAVN